MPSGDWAYAPLSGDGVMRLPTNPNRPPVSADADRRTGRRGTAEAADPSAAAALKPLSLDAAGRVESAPIAYEGGVVWCTEAGRIVAVVPADKAVTGSEWTRIEFDLNAPPAGPLVVRGSTIYAATTQGDLARIDDLPPNDVHEFSLTWHVVLPQPPEGGLLVGDDTVAISLGDEGIMAFAAASGEQRWRSCTAGRLVSITGQRLWCVDRVGRLAGLDLASGMPSVWLCLGSFTLPVTNTVDGRLILASPDGLVVSLAPRRTVAAAPPPEPPQPTWKPGDERAAPADADEATPVDTTAT